MTIAFERFCCLSPTEQRRIAQGIYAGPEHPPFFGIKKAFLQAHPECAAVEEVFVGGASGLGPLNAITVTTKQGARLRLPKEYMGCPLSEKALVEAVVGVHPNT